MRSGGQGVEPFKSVFRYTIGTLGNRVSVSSSCIIFHSLFPMRNDCRGPTGCAQPEQDDENVWLPWGLRAAPVEAAVDVFYVFHVFLHTVSLIVALALSYNLRNVTDVFGGPNNSFKTFECKKQSSLTEIRVRHTRTLFFIIRARPPVQANIAHGVRARGLKV